MKEMNATPPPAKKKEDPPPDDVEKAYAERQSDPERGAIEEPMRYQMRGRVGKTVCGCFADKKLFVEFMGVSTPQASPCSTISPEP